MQGITFRHGDVFGIAAIGITPHHRAPHAELFVAGTAIEAVAAAQDVMHADAVAHLDRCYLLAHLFNHTRDLVPQRPGQWSHRRFSRSIVDVGVTNARSPNAHQHIVIADRGHWDFLHL